MVVGMSMVRVLLGRGCAAMHSTASLRQRLHYSSVSKPQLLRAQGSGGNDLQEDLVTALEGLQKTPGKEHQHHSSGSGSNSKLRKPKFAVALVSNYGKDLTEKTLASAVRQAGLSCPIIGCQAKGIREVRRGARQRHLSRPRVQCWSLNLKDNKTSAFGFYQRHTSLPDVGTWSGNTRNLADLVLNKPKQPYTFALGGPDLDVGDFVRRQSNIFDSALHVGATPRGPVQDLFFLANATGKAGKGKRHIVSPDGGGIVGLCLDLGSKVDTNKWLQFTRQVLSSHWWHEIEGCRSTNGGLFVPSRKGASVSSQVRHVHKYMIADFADGVPMFPISGACLYPATEMQLRIHEPRYKAMVKQCIENNEIFGFIPKDDRNNRFVDTIGTCAYVKEIAEVGPTGESIIVIKGLRRFRFKSLRIQPGSFGLNYADIEFFDDDQSDDTDEYATTEGFGTELQLLAQKAQSFLGGDQHLMASAHDMSFALADALPAPQGQKIRWLKSTRTADRLNEAMEFLSNYRRE